MTDWAMDEALAAGRSAGGWLVAWARDLAVAVVIAAWIGALGPFGNYGAGALAPRIAFHLTVAVFGVLAFGGSTRWAVRTGGRVGISPLVAAPAAIALTCLPMSALVAVVGVAFFPRLAHLLSPVDWCVQTVVLILPLVCAYVWLLHLSARAHLPAPARSGQAQDGAPVQIDRPRLSDRRLTRPAEILALKVEDHYVRVYTGAGCSLLLMRLSDAIAEMDGVDGLRVHRSWWVSRRAVADLRLTARGGRLLLCNGLRVPIARSMLGDVRAAGWTGLRTSKA